MNTRHVAILALFGSLVCAARLGGAATSVDTPYGHVIADRAAKLVAPLGLNDPAKATRVRDLVAGFYRDLNAIQQSRDAAIKEVKTEATLDKSGRDAAIKAARDRSDVERQQLHDAFVDHLARELTPDQIDRVKDGLTYGVAPLTFRVYQQMLPNLTAAQKDQIHAWLLEAREHAMDGFTSEEKHAWFGKYKGRINNFLAKAGYDVKAAEKNLHAQR